MPIINHQPPTTNHQPSTNNQQPVPAFKYTKGYEAVINHGETLFIPQLWWHYVYYSRVGYSLALRVNNKFSTKLKGMYNIIRLFTIDNSMNFLLRERWKKWKYKKARKKADNALKKIINE
ncbi:hypothetical protein GWK08_10330 [Leptobacterium flavescens]|uniref:Cupin-like domain-containing protein n=1 Tax=Leptobacterium flavescens TaxID=472055 RepID=A0A6P0ULH6_9FLAO|nr:cupin-like domain-containing protein [Leptobacterium flavescens]NER13837.1 hypothetical protein [Leptobacterium flavescens]